MSVRLFQQYSRYENGVIEQFNNQPFYAQGICSGMNADQFRYYLLQIGIIAHNFVRWYETVKLGIADEEGKEVIRSILRSEIPRTGPTHQDDRFADLVLAGIDPKIILTAPPTKESRGVVENLFQITRYNPAPHYDLAMLVILRVAGEILVAEQYTYVAAHWRDTLGLSLGDSRFFVPHMDHDKKRTGGRSGHTCAFDKVLTRLICNDEALRIAKSAAGLAMEVRSSIHDQFVLAENSAKGIPGIRRHGS